MIDLLLVATVESAQFTLLWDYVAVLEVYGRMSFSKTYAFHSLKVSFHHGSDKAVVYSCQFNISQRIWSNVCQPYESHDLKRDFRNTARDFCVNVLPL